MAHDIVQKIQQMVAKAESTDSAAEAESIMVKVREMLDRHGISLLSVKRHANDYDPVATSRDIYGFWAADNWMRKLSDAAAWYYGVRIVWTKRGNYTSIAVVGRESCRAAFTAMLPYLRGQVNRLASQGWSRHDYPTVSKGRSQIGLALAHRLYALWHMKQEEQAAHTVAASGMNMLVPVDKLKMQMEEDFPGIKPIKDMKDRARPSAKAIADAATINVADQLKKDGAPAYVIGRTS